MSRPITRPVRARACAKINLTLRVLGIRPDGYHELRTTFQSVALHDTLTFTTAGGPFAITSDHPGCPTDATNLVSIAARHLWRAAGRRGVPRDLRVHIAKRIPVEAGLGGGSSDAAAALRALNLLWGLNMSTGELEDIARNLGADVAFFLEGGAVLGVERGDLLFPLQDAPPAWVVLARPDFGISTKDAYGWWDQAHRARRTAMARPATRADEWVNDLQGPVAARHRTIPKLVRQLKRSGARHAAMSGSGSAVFGLFDGRDAAIEAAEAISGPRVTTWTTRTTGRREHLRVTAPTLT
jgi:4-diphosphocytidyl-2-C-methyl-D-erythritol kinase